MLQERRRLVELSKCGSWAGHLAGAAVGVALATTDWRERWPVAFDLGLAAQNMMLAAHELGIGSVMANIYEIERANALLELPPPTHVLCRGFRSGILQQPRILGVRREKGDAGHWTRSCTGSIGKPWRVGFR